MSGGAGAASGRPWPRVVDRVRHTLVMVDVAEGDPALEGPERRARAGSTIELRGYASSTGRRNHDARGIPRWCSTVSGITSRVLEYGPAACPFVTWPRGSDAAPSTDAAEDEQHEGDDGQDDENCPQHCETPSR
jgi:hypothetical protein